jgi:hypothetical protein
MHPKDRPTKSAPWSLQVMPSATMTTTRGFYIDLADSANAEVRMSISDELQAIVGHRGIIENAKSMSHCVRGRWRFASQTARACRRTSAILDCLDRAHA